MLKLAKTKSSLYILPKYPAVIRDLAIVVNKNVLASNIEKADTEVLQEGLIGKG
jgi:phenylalanyl-tRNA synthetase beta subunit